MSAVEAEFKLELSFNEQTGEIQFVIHCPEDDLFTPSAFGSVGSVLEDVASNITKIAKEIGLDLGDIHIENFIDPKILSGREALKKILKK